MGGNLRCQEISHFGHWVFGGVGMRGQCVTLIVLMVLICGRFSFILFVKSHRNFIVCRLILLLFFW